MASDDDLTTGNLPEYSVSEISQAVKRTVEDTFPFVRVRGELSRVSRPRSGHIYVDLKDDRAVLGSVIWKGTVARLRVDPEEGLEVVATGRLTTYPGQSKYQLVIEQIEVAGLGALMAMLEKRKKQFAAEGLFAAERKQPIPYLPQVIGVVTSPSGAVIRDILHRLADRFPRHVILWPVAVQGEGAKDQIAAAIEGFNKLDPNGPIPRPDVLIVARGGGSVEDLWAFNEEVVVRAAAASDIPLISAVGHETDTTLIDYVSDRRAPTPTGAAEITVPVRAEILADVLALEGRLVSGMERLSQQRRQDLASLARALPRADALLGTAEQRLDFASERLAGALRVGLLDYRARFRESAARMGPSLLRMPVARAHEQAESLGERLNAAWARALTDTRETLKRSQQRLDELAARISSAATRSLAERERSLISSAKLLESLGHQGTLKRGFALVRNDAGKVVRAASAIAKGDLLSLEFADGAVAARAEGGDLAKSKKPAPQKVKPSGKQASLFDDGEPS
jgi:exodeoxyribonuclease VII large subunit